MDNYITISNQLSLWCPDIDPLVCQRMINDSWRELQAMLPWSFRKRYGIFSPPNIYQAGQAITNIGAGNPNLITGIDTEWTPNMVGRQIRLGGFSKPWYDIIGFQSATGLYISPSIPLNSVIPQSPWLLSNPWDPDIYPWLDGQPMPYQILQMYYPVPDDWGYWDYIINQANSYQLWTGATEFELSIWDPQRTTQGSSTGAAVFRDYQALQQGTVGPIVAIGAQGAAPISTTSTGFTFIADATYVIKVIDGGTTGTATFQWMRAGQAGFSLTQDTSDQAIDLMDGVQIYWPDSQTYVANDIFIINCSALANQGVARMELWPAPTSNTQLFPYQYFAKETQLSVERPQLPPTIAARGDILLQAGRIQAAQYPGTESRPNGFFSLNMAQQHRVQLDKMLVDLCRNDDEITSASVTYKNWPYADGPWQSGQYRQTHDGPPMGVMHW